MLVRRCDKCKEIGEPGNLVRSHFKITYSRDEFVVLTKHFDLCEKCAKEIYKAITGEEPLKKII